MIKPLLSKNNFKIIFCKKTHFIDDVALLLIVKFSANEASELSKSPVRTLPGCCWFWVDCAEPGISDGWCVGCCVKLIDCPLLPAGLKTSPNGSKPFVF